MSDGSLAGYDSVEQILQVSYGLCQCSRPLVWTRQRLTPALLSPNHQHLQEQLAPEQLAAVRRVLYGANQGQPVAALELPKPAQAAAAEQGFDLQGYQFKAAAEQMRAPRIVRIGLIQHGIVKPTTAPFLEQRQVCVSRRLVVCVSVQKKKVVQGGTASAKWAHAACA